MSSPRELTDMAATIAALEAELARLREREAQSKHALEAAVVKIHLHDGERARAEARVARLEEALREIHDEVLGKSGSKIRAIARRALAHEEEA